MKVKGVGLDLRMVEIRQDRILFQFWIFASSWIGRVQPYATRFCICR
jgi:hypothetical protein